MYRHGRYLIIIVLLLTLLSGCTYNPFIRDNHLTGSATPTLFGAGVGAGTVALFKGSTPAIVAGGFAGGALGYYISTLRFASGGVIHGGGKVYRIGDLVGIEIPSDYLFVVNTAELSNEAPAILNSVVAILKRYPQNNILISGNTSGFSFPRWERRISLLRAQRVAAWLWKAGIGMCTDGNTASCKHQLQYVGYGDYFPISSDLTNRGVRENSRIQITSYPDDCTAPICRKRIIQQRHIADFENGMGNEVPQRCGNDPHCYEGAG